MVFVNRNDFYLAKTASLVKRFFAVFRNFIYRVGKQGKSMAAGYAVPDLPLFESRLFQADAACCTVPFEEEIKQGYITIAGGHRVGMVGQVVTEDREKIRTMKYIRGINIRIAHEIKGVATEILPFLYEGGKTRSVLLMSPPGGGKTTLLRDVVRNFSDGTIYGKGVTVGVVDERSEIAGCYMGQPQNDMGIRTDVLDACPKVSGMMLLLRAMSPKVIPIDELGSREELAAVSTVSNCGVKILATMHAENLEDLYRREGVDTLLSQRRFEMILILYKDNGHYSLKAMYEWDDKGGWKCCDY